MRKINKINPGLRRKIGNKFCEYTSPQSLKFQMDRSIWGFQEMKKNVKKYKSWEDVRDDQTLFASEKNKMFWKSCFWKNVKAFRNSKYNNKPYHLLKFDNGQTGLFGWFHGEWECLKVFNTTK